MDDSTTTTSSDQPVTDNNDNSSSVPPVSSTTTLNSPSLRFAGVQLFFFRRKQGFNCVPSKGGTTLGMAERHFDEHRVSFDSGHGDGEEDIEVEGESSNNLSFDASNEEEDEESARKSRKRPSSPVVNIALTQDKSSLAELRPLPVRQRRRLLRLSGVKKIDTAERFECEAIRLSRNECGCQSCGPVCLPDTCPCSINGIACQVDKMAYPCSCTREGCHNVEGRVEFNAVRVRRHLIHTLTKLYAAAEQGGVGSSEDSGPVEDEFLMIEDNCDDYGRCRHCNRHEPPIITLKRPTTQPTMSDMDEFSEDVAQEELICEEEGCCEEGEQGKEMPQNNEDSSGHAFSSPTRHTSAAIVATKMLRRKLRKSWRQKAQSSACNKTGNNRLVSKLFQMRRAMSSAPVTTASTDVCQ